MDSTMRSQQFNLINIPWNSLNLHFSFPSHFFLSLHFLLHVFSLFFSIDYLCISLHHFIISCWTFPNLFFFLVLFPPPPLQKDVFSPYIHAVHGNNLFLTTFQLSIIVLNNVLMIKWQFIWRYFENEWS